MANKGAAMRLVGGAGVAPMPALIGPARPPRTRPFVRAGPLGAAPLKPLFLSERMWRVHMRAYAAVCTCAYVHVRVNITAGLSVCRLTVGSLMAPRSCPRPLHVERGPGARVTGTRGARRSRPLHKRSRGPRGRSITVDAEVRYRQGREGVEGGKGREEREGTKGRDGRKEREGG